MAYYKAIMDNSVVVEEDASTLSGYFDAASNMEVKKGSEV